MRVELLCSRCRKCEMAPAAMAGGVYTCAACAKALRPPDYLLWRFFWGCLGAFLGHWIGWMIVYVWFINVPADFLYAPGYEARENRVLLTLIVILTLSTSVVAWIAAAAAGPDRDDRQATSPLAPEDDEALRKFQPSQREPSEAIRRREGEIKRGD